MIAPKLRFQGFVKDLEQHEFRDFIKSSKYGPRFDAKDYDINGNVKTIRGTDVSLDATIKYEQVPIANLPQSMIDEHRLQNGDILMITTADCGLSAVFEKQEMPYIASAYAVRICLNEKMDSHWAKYYLQTNHITNEVNKYIRKGTLSNLPLSDISRFIVNVPALKEQTKIAEFLSAVDDKISQLSRQLELLNQYKKGVMQKIFSQEIRFNGFNDEWEGRKIGDFITKYVGGASFTPSDFVKKSNFEVIPKKAITARGLLRLDALNPTFSSEEFYQQNQNYTVDKTYLITTLRDLVPSGPNIGYIVSFENEKKYILAQGVYGFQTKNINRQFLIQYSNTDKFRKIMQSKLVGSTQVHIRNQDYFDTEILVPSIPEQEKIAEFLTAIDERIDHTTAQLTHTKQWKKGLLQQMFV